MLNRDEQTIDVADFLVEMQAARIAGEHDILRFILQNDVMEKLDFFDYLTFFPLFLYSHESIVAEDVLFAWTNNLKLLFDRFYIFKRK